MKGLELSRQYFEAYGLPMLEKEFREYRDVIAAGLVGQGSECFGFDDVLSCDHDFGAGFCLWIPEKYLGVIGVRLQRAYESLPAGMDGNGSPYCTPQRRERIGVHSIESFYTGLIGCPGIPETNLDWLRIPERYLAMASNGEVFCDPMGRFSEIHRALRNFYPEDVRKKKLAAKCAAMGQSGQYNYVRSLRRGSPETAALTCGQFVMAALGALYLLNERYMPFYKWAFRGAEEFRELRSCVEDVKQLILLSEKEEQGKKILLIERICIQIRDALIRRGWSEGEDCFMQCHAEQIMEKIKDPVLRQLPLLAGE